MPASSDDVESDVVTARVVLGEPLHARPAGQLARALAGLEATVWLDTETRSADARSILNVLGLGADTGTEIVVRASGVAAEAALTVALGVLAPGLGPPS